MLLLKRSRTFHSLSTSNAFTLSHTCKVRFGEREGDKKEKNNGTTLTRMIVSLTFALFHSIFLQKNEIIQHMSFLVYARRFFQSCFISVSDQSTR